MANQRQARSLSEPPLPRRISISEADRRKFIREAEDKLQKLREVDAVAKKGIEKIRKNFDPFLYAPILVQGEAKSEVSKAGKSHSQRVVLMAMWRIISQNVTLKKMAFCKWQSLSASNNCSLSEIQRTNGSHSMAKEQKSKYEKLIADHVAMSDKLFQEKKQLQHELEKKNAALRKMEHLCAAMAIQLQKHIGTKPIEREKTQNRVESNDSSLQRSNSE